MKMTPFRSANRWFCRPHRAALLSLMAILAISSHFSSLVCAQRPEQDAELAGVKFVTPEGFVLERPTVDKIAFMRSAQAIALFVTVPGNQVVDDKYLTTLSNALVSRFLSGRNSFGWRILRRPSDRRVSTYQTDDGTTKGLDGKTFVQVDYVVVKAQGHEVVVGSIATFGTQQEARFLFDVEGKEYSPQGWQGVFHLIASITGEEDVGRNQAGLE
jgi:hypothetical protein